MSRARLLVVDDDLDMREALSQTLELAGYEVSAVADGYQALDVMDLKPVSMVISDVQMDRMDGHTLLKHIKARQPQMPVVLMTAYGSIPRAVTAMRDGAVDYLAKPFEAEVIVSMVGRFVHPEGECQDLVAADERSKELEGIARRVAKTDATILVTGESGVGKEVLARFIHTNSARAKKPFVAINCAAIPENMLEATLFGYEKGAFTGAYKSCPGKFEQAQGGTLLLDEISEMDLGLQAKLLRVLQEREVERLGGGKMIELDVRVLATSNRNLREEVEAGRFREDLFYRLNVFPIQIPPLRERRDDIIPLALRILERIAIRSGSAIPVLTCGAEQSLLGHSWPGNVRELDNVIQRAMILRQTDEIGVDDLHFEHAQAGSPQHVPEQDDGPGSLGGDVKAHEYQLIIEALNRNNGSRKKVAEALGISPRTLRYKLARMRDEGVDVPE